MCKTEISAYPRGGQAKAKGGQMLPPAPLKETLKDIPENTMGLLPSVLLRVRNL